MAEQVLDARTSAAFLRHRRGSLAKLAVVGAVVGLLYGFFVPAQLSSTTLVLLPGESPSAGDGGVLTQVRIASSRPVLERAGTAMSPAMSAEQVASRIAVDAPTSQLIQIVASASRAGEAQAMSQRVADSYIMTLRNNASSVTALTLSDLHSREAALTAQLDTLRTEIDATSARLRGAGVESPGGRRDIQLKAQLTAEQADISLQLDKVKESIAAYGTQGGVSVTATIIQPATPAVGDQPPVRLVTWTFTGAGVAALLSALVLLVRLQRDQRVRTRDGLADAVGSSVLADVRSRPQRSVAEWLAFFETYQASSVEAWAFRQVLRALSVPDDGRPPGRGTARRVPGRIDHPSTLTVVSLSGDPGGLTVGPQLAVFAASLGVTTRLVLATGHDAAASLGAACAANRSLQRSGLTLAARTDDAVARDSSGEPDAVSSRPATMADVLPGATPVAASRNTLSRIAAAFARRVEPRHARAAVPTEPAAHEVSGPAADVVSEPVAGEPVAGEPVAGEPVAGEPVAGESGEPVAEPLIPPAAQGEVGSREAPVPGDLADSALRTVSRSRVVDLTIYLAVVDDRHPTLRGVPLTAATMLAVAPGVATREALARIAVAVDDSGRRFEGIVVADVHESDRTTGRRTLDERSLRAPLPVRLTGISQVSVSGHGKGETR